MELPLDDTGVPEGTFAVGVFAERSCSLVNHHDLTTSASLPVACAKAGTPLAPVTIPDTVPVLPLSDDALGPHRCMSDGGGRATAARIVNGAVGPKLAVAHALWRWYGTVQY